MSDFEVSFGGDTSDLVRSLAQLSAAVDRTNANLDQTAAGSSRTSAQLEQLNRSVLSANDGMFDMNNIAADAAGALGVFGVAGIDLENPLTSIATLAKEAADAFVEYAGEVRQLSLSTGLAAEEASALIQASDDVGISADTLAKGFRRLIAEGITPSIDTMADLADEYNAIQDPVARTQFAIERFGPKAGPEMARLLAQGSDAIREMTDEAKTLGLTLDEEAVQAARNYEIALDNLGDRWQALQMQFGQVVVPALTAVTDAASTGFDMFEDYALAVGRLSMAISPLTLLLDDNQRASIEAGLASDSLVGFIGGVTDAFGDQTQAITDQRDASLDLEEATGDLQEAEEDRAAAQQSAAGVWRDAIQALKDANIAASEKLAIEARMRVMSGELSQDQATLTARVNDLTKMYADGKITAAEYTDILAEVAGTAGGAGAQLAILRDRINEIQSKEVTITYRIQRVGGDPPPGAGDVGIGPDAPPDQQGPSQPPPGPADPPQPPGQPQMIRGAVAGGISSTVIINQAYNTAMIRRTVELAIADAAAIASARRRPR